MSVVVARSLRSSTARAATAEDTSSRLEIEGLAKSYGLVTAVDQVSLTVERGEFLTILGPSGSGKTTLLKLVAGFEAADRGSIRVAGEEITDLDPASRNIGMVFQNYALFPHMTVERNVGYPLAMRGVAKAEIKKRVDEVLALVELADYGSRKPSQLSGGQQQRVALARAVVFHPRLLLLDEPFGALDRKLRDQMQLEVRRLQRRLGLTTIFITHDQEEALVMSDRIAVMDKGRIQQIGLPHDLYEAPRNAFIANFIGESNLMTGRLETASGVAELVLDNGARLLVQPVAGLTAKNGQRALVMVRPERFVDLASGGGMGLNRVRGDVIESAYTGGADRYRLKSDYGGELVARLPAGPGRRRYQPGEPIELGFAPADAIIVDAG